MKVDIARIVNHYFPDGDWHIIERQGRGMNNTTRFIEVEGIRYVLRVYETHRDADKVLYEHRVLLELGNCELPFKTPVPVHTKTGRTVVTTEDGKLAAMFRFIDGETPTLQDIASIRDFGMMTGALSSALASINLQDKPIYQPYYEIEHTYPSLGREEIQAFCMNPPETFATEELRSALAAIGDNIASFFQKLNQLKALPHQLIHGDLNASNALRNPEGKLIAILDFEFVAWDLRVMEVAVCLSDLIRMNEPPALIQDKIEAFFTGYTSNIHISKEELHALPTLLLLRRVDVFLHFLSRYRDGIDELHVVQDQILNTYRMLNWLNTNECMLRSAMQIH